MALTVILPTKQINAFLKKGNYVTLPNYFSQAWILVILTMCPYPAIFLA